MASSQPPTPNPEDEQPALDPASAVSVIPSLFHAQDAESPWYASSRNHQSPLPDEPSALQPQQFTEDFVLPSLEHMLWSENQQNQPQDLVPAFTTPMEHVEHPYALTPSEVTSRENGTCHEHHPSTAAQEMVQPPSESRNPIGRTTASRGNIPSLADEWMQSMQRDLSAMNAVPYVPNPGNQEVQPSGNDSDFHADATRQLFQSGADGAGPSSVVKPMNQLMGTASSSDVDLPRQLFQTVAHGAGPSNVSNPMNHFHGVADNLDIDAGPAHHLSQIGADGAGPSNISNIPNQLRGAASTSDIGAYVPSHHLYSFGADGARPSNPSSPLNELHGAQVNRTQIPIVLEHGNGLIPDAPMETLDRGSLQATPLQQEHPSQQLVRLHQQQNPYTQELVARSAAFNPVAPSDNPPLQLRPIHNGAITKPPRRRSGLALGKFRCQQCPEYFETKVNAQRHMDSCHVKNKRKYPCTQCSASYDSSGPRTLHMRRAHPHVGLQVPELTPIHRYVDGKSRFFCPIPGCNRNYSVSNNISRHFQMHHAKIRYPCTCGYEATTKFNLKAHQNKCRLHRED